MKSLRKLNRYLNGCLILMVVLASTPLKQVAYGAGQFEGALWSFHMTPKTGGDARNGTFRVEGTMLFQKMNSSDAQRSRRMGNKLPVENGKTLLTFTKLVGNKGKVIVQNAKVTIMFREHGEWSGWLVDGNGKNWKFKCSRIQE